MPLRSRSKSFRAEPWLSLELQARLTQDLAARAAAAQVAVQVAEGTSLVADAHASEALKAIVAALRRFHGHISMERLARHVQDVVYSDEFVGEGNGVLATRLRKMVPRDHWAAGGAKEIGMCSKTVMLRTPAWARDARVQMAGVSAAIFNGVVTFKIIVSHSVDTAKIAAVTAADDPQLRAVATSAAVGAVVLGGSAGAVGGVAGGAAGAVVGVVPAVFTLGFSIPVCAAVGGGMGLFGGLAAGGITGAACGGAMGYCGIWSRVCDSTNYVRVTAQGSATAVRRRLRGGTGGTA